MTSFGGFRKRLVNDRDAAIEGLPLQLMILVIIAGLATTLIVGWMGAIEMPEGIGAIQVEPGRIILEDREEGGRSADDVSLEVLVSDSFGDPLPGATVVLSGCGVSDGELPVVYAVTGEDGIATFDSLSLRTDGDMGYLSVVASKSGYNDGSEARVLVI